MFKSLQAARAVAALMVVVYHLGKTIERYLDTAAFVAPWGRAGVEFFFVLSGFIIATAHWGDIGKPERLGRFAWKRFVRIYPIYWVVFLVVFAAASRIPRIQDFSAAEIVRALVLAPAPIAPVITVAWTLQWEMVFYVLFGALIVHPVLALAGLGMAVLWLPTSPTYLLLFLAGVACAVVDRREPRMPGRLVALLGALVFAGACAVETARGAPQYFWLGLGAALLVLGLVQAERAGQAVGAHPLPQLLGDASYSIYLVHYPIIIAVCKAAARMGWSGPGWGLAVYPVTLVVSVLAGVLMHLFVEKPLLTRLTSWRPGALRSQP